MRKTLLSGAFLWLALSVAGAQEASPKRPVYEITNIQTFTKRVGWVDNAWKSYVPCIQADLRVTQDTTDEKYVRAYFYDKDNQIVQKDDKPPQVSDNYSNYVGMPAIFKPFQGQKVFFPISAKATQPSTKWLHVVIVFGDRSTAAAMVYPKVDLEKFDFPEKELVPKSATAAH